MNKQNIIKKLLEAKEYKNVKVGKHQIYRDGTVYVVEKFEYVDSGTDMFSVYDGYEHIEEAVEVTMKLDR